MKKQLRLASVALPDAAADAPTVWVQVTKEGDYKGYPGGGFKFTPEVLGQLVRNFRANPSFELGPMGEGVADVIPWDFNHASEMPATEGGVPLIGAPAQGWTQDLQLRMGPSGGELWAKVRWLEPARGYVKSGQYKWASVTVIFDAMDPKSGKNVGAVLTSIALTNTPFVEGMAPLAASRGGLPRLRVHLPAGMNRNSPEARKLARAIAEGRVTVLRAEESDDEPSEPISEEDRQALAATRQKLASTRDKRAPMLLDASAATGRNQVEKAIRAMRAHGAAFAQLPWEEQCARASTALRLGTVRIEKGAE